MKIRKSESIFYDFEKEGGEALLLTEGATYEIRDKQNTLVGSGALTKNENVLELRLDSTDTEALLPNTYVLLVAFEDSESGYKDFIMDESLQIIK